MNLSNIPEIELYNMCNIMQSYLIYCEENNLIPTFTKLYEFIQIELDKR